VDSNFGVFNPLSHLSQLSIPSAQEAEEEITQEGDTMKYKTSRKDGFHKQWRKWRK